jgi:hypothetical protein
LYLSIGILLFLLDISSPIRYDQGGPQLTGQGGRRGGGSDE